MQRSQVYSAVSQTIGTIHSAGGHGGRVSGSTRPMRDLSGFDSLNAVEATCQISASLGYEIPEDVGLFFNRDTGEANTVNEIVDKICAHIEQMESA
jgi:acyl carrier protein